MAYAKYLLVICLLSACGSDEPERSARPPERRPRVTNTAPPPPKEKLTDAQGNLLAGNDKVAWFEIPKGFSRKDYGDHHVFSAHDIPTDRVEAFVGARALSLDVERQKRGVVFHRAAPISGAAGALLEIAVALGPRPSEVILTVDEFPPAKAPPLPFEQARTALTEDMKRAE